MSKNLFTAMAWATAGLSIAIGGLAYAAQPADADDQWLEQPHGERALAWARQSTQASTAALQASPLYPAVRTELTDLLKGRPAEPDVVLLGQYALRFLKDAGHPYGLLQMAQRNADGVPATPWKTVLDVAQLRKDEGIAFELQAYNLADSCLSATARCLLRLSPGGGDEVEIREFDLAQAAFVAGGFKVPRSRAFAQWLNADKLLVETTAGDRPKTAAGWPAQVSLWARGEPLARAKPVYQGEPGDAILQLGSTRDDTSARGIITRAIDYSTFEVHVVDPDGRTRQLPLPRDLAPMGVIDATDTHVIVQLGNPAQLGGKHYAAETVLAYNVDPAVAEADRISVIFAPDQGEFVNGKADVVSVGRQVALVSNRNLRQRLLLATPEAGRWKTREVLQAEPGDTLTVRGGEALIVATDGFTTPRRQELYPQQGSPRLLARDPVMYERNDYLTEIGSATSRDGTQVDYFLLRPRTPASGPQPLLVTGYAAFATSFRPGYFDYIVGGPAFKLWLERGGSLVIPAARGGNERGEAWHRAAMREKRQNSYDDFIAVIEKLHRSGYSNPAHTGVFGSSNGGLLAATLGTQRPDLFGAVISDVPLTDLIRMRHMGMGAAWMNEYGHPDTPAEAKAMLAYSPYQNVRSGVDYPPFLMTISTEDNRVGPGHARKFAARLQSVGAPVHFLEDEEGGHGVSDALRNPDLMAMRMSFLIDQLMAKQP